MTQRDYVVLSDFRFQIRRFLRFSEQAASAEGLEPQQHQFLLALQAAPEDQAPTVGHIAERLLIQHHSAVGLTDRLERRGLLQRERGASDRRQVRLRITAEGTAVIQRLSTLHGAELHESGPELVSALQALLQTIPPLVKK